MNVRVSFLLLRELREAMPAPSARLERAFRALKRDMVDRESGDHAATCV